MDGGDSSHRSLEWGTEVNVAESERATQGGGLEMILVLRKCGAQGCQVGENTSRSDRSLPSTGSWPGSSSSTGCSCSSSDIWGLTEPAQSTTQLKHSVQQHPGTDFGLRLKLTQFLASRLRLSTHGGGESDSWSKVRSLNLFQIRRGGGDNRSRKNSGMKQIRTQIVGQTPEQKKGQRKGSNRYVEGLFGGQGTQITVNQLSRFLK